MSTDTTSRLYQSPGVPGGVRFRPRDHPPEPLFGPPNCNYPGSDGRPMADNTLQFDWIAKIKGGLDVVFQDNPDVFVAGNLFWYPVEEKNRRRLAPDAMVIFGRPKGYRTSYVQHHEDGIPPQVVFEVLSPGNRKRVMDYKRNFYERYGVEEYYVFNPYKIKLEVWLMEGETFRPIADAETSGWVSPKLGIRFELGEDMTIFAPDGRPFLDYAAVDRERAQAARERDELARERDEERRRAGQAERRLGLAEHHAETERQRAEAERQQAEAERERAAQAEQRAERMAAKLRELGLEPEA